MRRGRARQTRAGDLALAAARFSAEAKAEKIKPVVIRSLDEQAHEALEAAATAFIHENDAKKAADAATRFASLARAIAENQRTP